MSDSTNSGSLGAPASDAAPSSDERTVEPIPRGAIAMQEVLNDLPREHGFVPLEIEGRIPEDLTGLYAAAGIGATQSFGETYRHMFDCDGAVTAVRIAQGRATGACRLVETPERLAERRAGRPLYGGVGTPVPGGPLERRRFWMIKNTGNTAAWFWRGRLYALWEAGRPTEIDPLTLRTLGRARLGKGIGRTFSGHPRRVPGRRTWYNFGVDYIGVHASLQVYELADHGATRTLTRVRLPWPTYLHDFIATERYLLFAVPPVQLDRARMVLGAPPFELMRWRPELGSRLLVVPIDDPAHPRWYAAPPGFQFHFSNGWDDNRSLHFDCVALDRFPELPSLTALRSVTSLPAVEQRLLRARLDLRSGELTLDELLPHFSEFPSVSPARWAQRHRHVYAQFMPAFGAPHTAKVDCETGAVTTHDLGPHQHVGESTFVARRKAVTEDDGYLLGVGYDQARGRSFLQILDAQRIDAPPLARLWFDHLIPLCLHGSWAEA